MKLVLQSLRRSLPMASRVTVRSCRQQKRRLILRNLCRPQSSRHHRSQAKGSALPACSCSGRVRAERDRLELEAELPEELRMPRSQPGHGWKPCSRRSELMSASCAPSGSVLIIAGIMNSLLAFCPQMSDGPTCVLLACRGQTGLLQRSYRAGTRRR